MLFEIGGYISLLGGIISLLLLILLILIWLIFKGVLKVLYRLGKSLAMRKIYILAKGENFDNLKGILENTKLFNNIEKVTIEHLAKIEKSSICIVNRSDIKGNFSDIENIILNKEYKIMWIFYDDKKNIDQQIYNKLQKFPNVIVVNAKGRLVNDVFTSLVTLPD